MATFAKVGYGQVEPNHLSAQRTGQIYAQLPWDAPANGVLENGAFLRYDYEQGKANIAGESEFLLVYNEVKLYDKARQGYKDFALKVADSLGGVVTPRLFKVQEGDIFTTNNVVVTTDKATLKHKYVSIVANGTTKVGDLTEVGAATDQAVPGPVFQIVKVYTMPDGSDAVKLQHIGNYTIVDGVLTRA